MEKVENVMKGYHDNWFLFSAKRKGSNTSPKEEHNATINILGYNEEAAA